MARFITLMTANDKTKVSVNINQIAYFREASGNTMIYFAGETDRLMLAVSDTPEEVAAAIRGKAWGGKE